MSARRTVEALTPLVDTRISGREQRPRTLAPLADHEPVSKWERARRAKFLRNQAEQREADERARNLPAYIHACFNNPKRTRTYWVYTWKPGDPSSKKRIPYQCGSWKCVHCQPHAGHVLFARLQEAWATLDPIGTVFVVLTLDPEWHREARHDLAGVYREFSKRQNRWMKRLRRYLIDRYGVDMGNRWASVTECHRTGVPHVNIAIHHRAWALDLRREQQAARAAGLTEFQAIQAEPELLRHAEECGFGWRCTIEANRDDNVEAITGYLVKGVKRADKMHGEIAKLSQLPVMAPKNFRRLRAGVGFVPPKHKGDCTGTIIRRYRTREGDEETEPLSKPKFQPEPNRDEEPEAWEHWKAEYERKLSYMREVFHAVAIEQAVAWTDEARPEGKREELIQRFVRRPDGVTSCDGVVVLNVPKVEGRPPPRAKPVAPVQRKLDFGPD